MKEEAVLMAFDCLDVQLTKTNNSSYEQLITMLSDILNDLIASDFNKLLSILYRIDVSEEKITNALANNTEHKSAGLILAELIIERQQQKILFRKQFNG